MSNGLILLVEDEQDILTLNRKYLEKHGYEVLCADNIKTARSIVWERPPDLVILDVILPDGSGYDFCKWFRESYSAPVLYLTCMSDEKDIIHGLSNGGDDYLTKPYSVNILLARVAAILRRSRKNSGIIELPPLKINYQTGEAHIFDRKLNLSPKELQLLAFFALHTGCAFSSNEIAEAVWNDTSGTMDRNIRVHISKLRKKLADKDDGYFDLSFTPEHKYIFLKVRYTPEW